jgi:hypothetical protein
VAVSDLNSKVATGGCEEISVAVQAEMAQMPGFISTLLASDSKRGYTITAWADVESPKPLLREGGQREAMKAFSSSDFTEGAMTSVWIPHHINALWVRCSACGQLSDYEKRERIYAPVASPCQRCPTGNSSIGKA